MTFIGYESIFQLQNELDVNYTIDTNIEMTEINKTPGASAIIAVYDYTETAETVEPFEAITALNYDGELYRKK